MGRVICLLGGLSAYWGRFSAYWGGFYLLGRVLCLLGGFYLLGRVICLLGRVFYLVGMYLSNLTIKLNSFWSARAQVCVSGVSFACWGGFSTCWGGFSAFWGGFSTCWECIYLT